MKVKESLLISIVVILIYIYFFSNNVELMTVNINNKNMHVLKKPDKQQAAELLYNLTEVLFNLRNYLVLNINKYTDNEIIDSIKLLETNMTRDGTKITEVPGKSGSTSFNVNKGEQLSFCLRYKDTDKLHDLNTVVYVGVHEISHSACHEIGHTRLFNKIFHLYLKEAVNLNLYKYENYEKESIYYCGMHLYSQILNSKP